MKSACDELPSTRSGPEPVERQPGRSENAAIGIKNRGPMTEFGTGLIGKQKGPLVGALFDWWCRRGESNSHGRKVHWILNPARLPISPLRHCFGYIFNMK